jgi:excisionase family DNA binding protein
MSEYLTTGQAAEELGVSAETVRRWVKAGLVPAMVTPGGRHLIDRADLDKLRPRPLNSGS